MTLDEFSARIAEMRGMPDPWGDGPCTAPTPAVLDRALAVGTALVELGGLLSAFVMANGVVQLWLDDASVYVETARCGLFVSADPNDENARYVTTECADTDVVATIARLREQLAKGAAA